MRKLLHPIPLGILLLAVLLLSSSSSAGPIGELLEPLNAAGTPDLCSDEEDDFELAADDVESMGAIGYFVPSTALTEITQGQDPGGRERSLPHRNNRHHEL